MDEQISSHDDVIDLWPSAAAMYGDVRLFAGDKKVSVRSWKIMHTIPPAFFDAVIAAAEMRGFEGVTYLLLTELYKASKRERKTSHG